ncbi:MAG: sigma-54 dependent transcriptional regulator [Candidatus Poribacteria bacterium]|nr:sigma-54 dependent transcriptional regulator [Candidatus Poribacteria bacterium]
MNSNGINTVASDLSAHVQKSAKILIVDDVPANLNTLYAILDRAGYEVLAAPNGAIALKNAAQATPDIILLDIMMPNLDGYEVCRKLKQNPATARIPVIFITAKEEKESLHQAFRVGGVDYIQKPFEKEELLLRIETHLEICRLTKQLLEKNTALTLANEQLRLEIAGRQQAEEARDQAEEALSVADEQLSLISQREAEQWGIASFVGKSQTVGNILKQIRRLHRHDAINVLIFGESGTGKELIARAIHFGSAKAKAPFIPVNCSAIPLELAEAAFFGHIRGAFTGANAPRKGYFEVADGGTLFLDEIGDMPPELQAKLLRVIEDGRVIPVGSMTEKRVDVRIIAATNTDLQAKMDDGVFRMDFYFRLAQFIVDVPPLRERREDIPLLTTHFIKMFAQEMGIENPTMSTSALERLMSYRFPGNVREFKNIVEHALISSNGTEIQPSHLHFTPPPTASRSAGRSPFPIFYGGQRVDLQQISLKYHSSISADRFFSRVSLDVLLTAANAEVKSLERAILREALRQNNENREQTAKVLGIDRKTLYRKLKAHQIE